MDTLVFVVRSPSCCKGTRVGLEDPGFVSSKLVGVRFVIRNVEEPLRAKLFPHNDAILHRTSEIVFVLRYLFCHDTVRFSIQC